MADTTTGPTDADVQAFLALVPDERRRADKARLYLERLDDVRAGLLRELVRLSLRRTAETYR